MAEIGGNIPENQPRVPHNLKRDKALNTLPRFQDVQFNDELSSATEITQFIPWLANRPESHIMVVCHHNVILKLLNMFKLRATAGISKVLAASHLLLHELMCCQVANCTPIHCMFEGALMVSVDRDDGTTVTSNQNTSKSCQNTDNAGRSEQLAAKLAAKNTRKQKKKKK